MAGHYSLSIASTTRVLQLSAADCRYMLGSRTENGWNIRFRYPPEKRRTKLINTRTSRPTAYYHLCEVLWFVVLNFADNRFAMHTWLSFSTIIIDTDDGRYDEHGEKKYGNQSCSHCRYFSIRTETKAPDDDSLKRNNDNYWWGWHGIVVRPPPAATFRIDNLCSVMNDSAVVFAIFDDDEAELLSYILVHASTSRSNKLN